MKIGVAYDLKEEVSRQRGPEGHVVPEDALEEYDSPETVEGLTGAIKSCGHSVAKLGGGRTFLANIVREPVDLVFNIAEGLGSYRSREAQVPSVLEMLDVPYSGADPQCLAVCLDKVLTKRLVALDGVRTPRWVLVKTASDLDNVDWAGFPFPAFAKPAYEGSSKGVRLRSRVESLPELRGLVTSVLEAYGQPVMIEEFIAGDEVTVGIVGNSPPVLLGIMRVVPRQPSPNFVYSLEVKRDWENLVDYECPARLSQPVLDEIKAFALKAFGALGCRDFARVDFRVSPSGVPYFLEINPLAGLNPKSSDLPIMARKVGWTYDGLIAAILEAAAGRYPGCLAR